MLGPKTFEDIPACRMYAHMHRSLVADCTCPTGQLRSGHEAEAACQEDKCGAHKGAEPRRSNPSKHIGCPAEQVTEAGLCEVRSAQLFELMGPRTEMWEGRRA